MVRLRGVSDSGSKGREGTDHKWRGDARLVIGVFVRYAGFETRALRDSGFVGLATTGRALRCRAGRDSRREARSQNCGMGGDDELRQRVQEPVGALCIE